MTNDLIRPEAHEITQALGGSLANHPVMAYLAGLSESSRRPQKQALDVIAGYLTGGQVTDSLSIDWAAVRYSHAQAIRSKLAENYAAASANRMLTALRGVLRAAWRLGLMSSDDYHKAVDVQAVTGETIPAGRDLSSGEIQALLAECEKDPGPAGPRDAAIIGLMVFVSGCRRAEIIGLDLADFDPETGRLVITGKRNKQRIGHVTNGAWYALDDWLAIRGQEPGPLFWAIDKGGNLRPGRLTTQAIYNMLKRRGKAAGVNDFSPHDLRRTIVGDLLEAGADIATVANIVGHANTQTTRNYDRRGEKAKKKAVGLLHMPYTRRTA